MTLPRQGLLLVDKPAGPTSHDVVQAARRALRERRIGHTGTLDPAATGLLLLCVGKATRLQQYLLAWPKTYCGEIRLGYARGLVQHSDLPMTEIAFRVGYARSQEFSRDYHKHFGLTPREDRRRPSGYCRLEPLGPKA